MESSTRRRLPPGTLKPQRPNAGIEADFRKRLEAIVDELHRSVTYWLTAAYRAGGIPVEDLAADASRASFMSMASKRLAQRWTRSINEMAPKLGEHFARAATEHSDGELKNTLREAGWTVKLKMTSAANDVVRAAIHENVSLIKSIASEHLSDVESLVARSVAQGRDLKWLTDELTGRYGITRRRAANIAHHQNNAATSAIQRCRQIELGLTSVWRHSHAGKHPRPSHVAYDGKAYFPAAGAFIDGEWIWPGQLIGCKCVSCPRLPSRLRAE